MKTLTTLPLGEVATFIRGITFKPTDVSESPSDGSVQCLRTKNVQQEFDLSDVWWVASKFVKRKEQFLQPGDLLVSSANSLTIVGKCCWIPLMSVKTTFGGFVSALRPNLDVIDPRFLYYFFSSPRTQELVRSCARQTTNIANLDLNRCAQITVPVPAMSEQRRIAATLDLCHQVRSRRRETLTRLDDLTQSVFEEMFGDSKQNPKKFRTTTIGDIALQVTDGEHQTPKREETGILLLSARNVRQGRIDLSDVDYIGDTEYQRISKRCNPTEGDILISCSGSIGRVAVVPPMEPFSLVRSVALVRFPQDFVTPNYAQHYLQTTYMQRMMLQSANASSQANLFQGPIRKLPMLIPPLEMQAQFDRKCGAMAEVRESCLESISQLDSLITSYQSSALQGEL